MGGRSVGSGNPICGSTAGPPLDGPLATLLAARDAQDRMWSQPAPSLTTPLEKTTPESQAIVVAQQTPVAQKSKEKDIQAILDGDF